jgi:uncharacterized membrane protein YraQ (UPF0718 family)
MDFLNSFWHFLIISAPYFLVGLFFGGIIHSFVDMKNIKKVLGGNKFSSVIKAAIVGIPLPLCSCSVLPTAIALRKGGASKGATSSFLVATPESGVDSIAMTYGMMDLPMTILRPVAAFASAFVAGIGQYIFNEDTPEEVAQNEAAMKEAEIETDQSEPLSFIQKLNKAFRYAVGDLMDDMAFWLFIGLVAGSLIDFLLPENVFQNLSGPLGYLMVLGIGIPLYICASSSTPIAAAMMMKGMSPGLALVFLLVGPATNISNMLVMQKSIGKKGVLINIVSIIIVALLFSFITDWLYTTYAWSLDFKVGRHIHGEKSGLIESFFAGFLLLLILKGLYKEVRKKYFTPAKKACCHNG